MHIQVRYINLNILTIDFNKHIHIYVSMHFYQSKIYDLQFEKDSRGKQENLKGSKGK